MGEFSFLYGFGVIAVAVVAGGIWMNKSNKQAEAEKNRFAKNAKKRAEVRATLLKSVKNFKWSDQYAIGGGIIDKENKALFDLVNKFNQSIPDFQTPGQMLSILGSFKKYTQIHFPREEKLQQVSGYSFCEDHKKEHGALVEKLNGFIEKVMGANEDNVTDLAVEIGKFLEEWITGHVIESDLSLKPYVDRLRENVKSKAETA